MTQHDISQNQVLALKLPRRFLRIRPHDAKGKIFLVKKDLKPGGYQSLLI
jgi:hypothetical protein